MGNVRSENQTLAGRKALVAGAYGGMGTAVTAALVREGVACALMGRDPDRLEGVARAISEGAERPVAVACDLSDTTAIARAVPEAIGRLGGLNFVINCAGTHQLSRGDDGDLAAWDRIIATNLRGTYHLVRHALPEIKKTPGGAIIKIGSIASSYSGAGPFLATSRALDGYANALFEEIREHGTKVCTIRPGFVNTPLVDTSRIDPARMIQPDDIARTVIFVLTMPETACPTEITIRPQQSPYRR